MPKSTKLATRIAHDLDETPSRVQGWIEGGYGPGGDRDILEHFRRLAPLMGTGRDGDVAVLKLADDGWPCRRLGEVLTRLSRSPFTTDDPEQLVEYVMAAPELSAVRDLLLRTAGSLAPPKEYAVTEDIDEPALPELFVRSSFLPIADTMTGAPVATDEAVDLERMGQHHFSQLGIPAPTDEDQEAVAADDITALRLVVRLAGGAEKWLESADLNELARGVAAARASVEGLEAMGLAFSSLGDEERWRFIGRMTPVAAIVFTFLRMAVDALGLADAGVLPLTTSGESLLDVLGLAGSEPALTPDAFLDLLGFVQPPRPPPPERNPPHDPRP